MMTVGKLKVLINDYSKEKNVPHQILYQHFMFERFLKRLSISKYKSKFILKGGFLISSMIGIESRTTVDIDMTLKDIQMTDGEVIKVINKIINIDILDETKFAITNVEDIREDDKYAGIRITMLGTFNTLKVYFKLDFSTGDMITPKPILKKIPFLFSKGKIELWTYNLESILAEKLETIISRGELNTRLKDYYDIYIILKLYYNDINKDLLSEALIKTMKYRETIFYLDKSNEILTAINISKKMHSDWAIFISQNKYVGDIMFQETVHSIKRILYTI